MNFTNWIMMKPVKTFQQFKKGQNINEKTKYPGYIFPK